MTEQEGSAKQEAGEGGGYWEIEDEFEEFEGTGNKSWPQRNTRSQLP